MTTIAVLADPPVEGLVFSDLGMLDPAEATTLYGAMLADVCRTVQHGGADLLVNYRPAEQVPGDVDPEAAVRETLAGVLPSPEEARYEVQVGESRAGRVGNTLTHLLEREGEETVGVVEPTAPFFRREHVGTAAMKLRTSSVVLGPATDGRVYFAGFAEPVDFADAYATPAVETLTDRGLGADLEVDFLPMTPLVEQPGDLATAVSLLRARERAGRNLPSRTAAVVDDLELAVAADGSVTRNPN